MKKILDYALENENRQQADTTVLQIDLIKTRELIAAQRELTRTRYSHFLPN